MTSMRAKLQIGTITQNKNADGSVNSEQLHFHGVCPDKFDADGLSEDNTFAKYSPSVSLDIMVANPALFGKFKEGEKFYVDFTPAS